VFSGDNKGKFEEYLQSSFKYSNILTKKEYEKVSGEYERLYAEALPADKNATILDVGCGAGHFLYYLKKRGHRNYLGIDISPQQVEFCIRNISEKVKLADAIEFLKDKKGVYSVIVAHDLLEHIPKQKTLAFLDLIYQSLNNKGIFIARVPNMSNPFSLDSRYRDFTHETGFTDKNLYQILWFAGFRDIQISSTKIQIRSFRNRVRSLLVNLVHEFIKFLYYIQDFSVPKHLGKNLTVICKK